jgi:hypothetical protein
LLLLAGLALALVVALGGTASATAGLPTLDPKATLSASKTAAVATGTIVCTAGDEVEVTVIIQQSSGGTNAAAQGTGSVLCSGQVQTWAVTAEVQLGAGFKKGPAVALLGAQDLTDGSFASGQTLGLKLG